MFRELRTRRDTKHLLKAEADTRLTMLVGRDESVRDILTAIGAEEFRATFLILDPDLFAKGQEERWFGEDSENVLVLLDDGVPERSAHNRWRASASRFKIGQAVLKWEASQ